MKDIPIIYQDADLLIVNKPCGIAVQGGAGINVCLVDILERQTGSKVYPVHRLDKDTAGILVVARSSESAALVGSYISEKKLGKEYQAICFGFPDLPQGIISTAAGRAGNEKPAETRYKILASNSLYSLISLELITGRMHQIRMHLSSVGCPIVADDKYGDFTKNKEVRSLYSIRKLQLVANRLSLPVATKIHQFDISLPEHMEACLTKLGIV